MVKRLTLSACMLRPQTVATKGRLAQALLREGVAAVCDQGLRPLIYARFPLADAAGAHALMESGTHIGKIVL